MSRLPTWPPWYRPRSRRRARSLSGHVAVDRDEEDVDVIEASRPGGSHGRALLEPDVVYDGADVVLVSRALLGRTLRVDLGLGFVFRLGVIELGDDKGERAGVVVADLLDRGAVEDDAVAALAMPGRCIVVNSGGRSHACGNAAAHSCGGRRLSLIGTR